MNKLEIERFNQKPIMGIVRGIKEHQLEPLIKTAIDAGLETLEITMNTKGAPQLIEKACRLAGDRLMIGAGTVLSVNALNQAIKAGASYIVLPIMEVDVVAHCVEREIPVFPGALTPQEIFYAWQGGATMVKVFPTKAMGPGYFNEIKGPFNHIKLLACGGVTADNIGEYIKNGADAFAFGGSVFKPSWLDNGNFDLIGQEIEKLVHSYGQALSS